MEITQSVVHELLDYFPHTGKFVWKERGIHWFKDGYRTAEAECKRFNAINSGKEAFTSLNSDGFLHGSILKKDVSAHKVAWLYVYGHWPKYVNHKNRDKTDNRIENLEDRGDYKSEKIKIELTFEFAWSILDYDAETGIFRWKKRWPDLFQDGKYPKERLCEIWNTQYEGQEAFSRDPEGYIKGELFGIKVTAHRLAWFMTYGYWPKTIDHQNGDTSDNRIENLRDVTQQQNCTNQKRRKTNTSGRTGVQKSGNRWIATICFNYEVIKIGSYATFEEACEARSVKEGELGFHENHDR